jgi:MFS family permease
VFGYVMSFWALGSILGPCFGGLAAEPCTTWDFARNSEYCKDSSALLRRYPFFLPFAGCALLSAFSCIVTVFALSPEEDVRAVWSEEDDRAEVQGEEQGEEAQTLDAATSPDNDLVRCNDVNESVLV